MEKTLLVRPMLSRLATCPRRSNDDACDLLSPAGPTTTASATSSAKNVSLPVSNLGALSVPPPADRFGAPDPVLCQNQAREIGRESGHFGSTVRSGACRPG
jgi:hypothetical protein